MSRIRPVGTPAAPAELSRALPFLTVDKTAAVWWVSCHGGSGASTLARWTGLGTSIRGWPVVPDGTPAPVVLVCRASAIGTVAASHVVGQMHRAGVAPRTRLLGMVTVAASPRRVPRRVRDELRLIAGWVPHLWPVRWVEELIAVGDPRLLGVPPDVAALRERVVSALGGM